MSQKYYCFVDETWQETGEKRFVVGIVVVEDRDTLGDRCQDHERASGKGLKKWTHAEYKRKKNYMELILRDECLAGKMFFEIHPSGTGHLEATEKTIYNVLSLYSGKTTVVIDGLPKSQNKIIGVNLRQQRLEINKVRGIADENEPLIRLADALCGLVRASLEGSKELNTLLQQAIKTGAIVEIS